MSTRKGAPTPKRPRKPAKRKMLPYREKARRFIIAACIITFALSLITGLLVGLQGTTTSNRAAPNPPIASPSPSPSPEVDPQVALRLQAAVVAAYVATGIEEGDPQIRPGTTTLPARLASGEQAPQVAVPVSFRITRDNEGKLVVCARAAGPGTAVPDQYFAFPNSYEAQKQRRCPRESPTSLPRTATTSPLPPATSPSPSQ